MQYGMPSHVPNFLLNPKHMIRARFASMPEYKMGVGTIIAFSWDFVLRPIEMMDRKITLTKEVLISQRSGQIVCVNVLF